MMDDDADNEDNVRCGWWCMSMMMYNKWWMIYDGRCMMYNVWWIIDDRWCMMYDNDDDDDGGGAYDDEDVCGWWCIMDDGCW